MDDLIRFGTATAEMFEFLRACVEARLNIFVSGGTGSGKTTTLNVLSSFIPEDERIVTIEDAAELQLRQEHVVTLESRPPNLEGKGEITIRDLLRNALHMRPDRIIVGECRAGEALDMLQAMTTGQDGSLSTGHANTPPDMLRRLETMVLMTGYELPLRAIREQIASAVDLIVHTARLKDGSRKVVNITEVYGIEDDEILTQDIFAFEQTGFTRRKDRGGAQADRDPADLHGEVRGRGIELPPGEFGIPAEDPTRPGLGPATGRGNPRGRGGCNQMTSTAGGGRQPPAAWSTSRRWGRSIPIPASSSPEASWSRRASACTTSRRGSRPRAARSTRSSGPTGRCATRRSSTRSTRSGCAGSTGHADRPRHADAAAPAPRRLPGLDRGDRRGVADPACRDGRRGVLRRPDSAAV